MEHGKRIPLYHPFAEGRRNKMFQRYLIYPGGRTAQAAVFHKVIAEFRNEILPVILEWDVFRSGFFPDEIAKMFAYGFVFFQSGRRAVFADSVLEVLNLPVIRFKKTGAGLFALITNS